MLKKTIFSCYLVLLPLIFWGQVGIGTNNPSTTLEIEGEASDPIVMDGILPPRITGDQLAAKTYSALQRGTLIYVTDAAASPSGQVAAVTQEGYYSFNGGTWQPIDYSTGGSTDTPWRNSSDDSNAELGDAEIYYNGNIGIGIEVPERILHIYGANARIRIDRGTDCCPAFFLNEANPDGSLVGGWDITNQIPRFTIGYDSNSGGGSNNNFNILQNNGNTGIGYSNPSYKLHLNGTLRGANFISNTTTYPDYVFEAYKKGRSSIQPLYTFWSLTETANYIQEHKHLPGVQSIKDLEKTPAGAYKIDLSQTTIQLLEKVEELYLHTIDQQEKLDNIDASLQNIERNILELTKK